MEHNGTRIGYYEVDVRNYEFKYNQTRLRQYLYIYSYDTFMAHLNTFRARYLRAQVMKAVAIIQT